MSEGYEEIIEGETLYRYPPGSRHEEICRHLHTQIAACLEFQTSARLLDTREVVQISAGTMLRPDLALVTKATGKLWLAAEIISSEDHRADTVEKKRLYEEMNIPRLWMIDPRYDNLEVYHASQYGMALKAILAHRDVLTETLLPRFELHIADLFGLKRPK